MARTIRFLAFGQPRPIWESDRVDTSWTVHYGLSAELTVFMGTGVVGLLQVVTAGLTRATLYAFRRQFTFTVPAMIAHSIWEVSTFLTGTNSAPWLSPVGILLLVIPAIC